MEKGVEERFQDALSGLVGGREMETDNARTTALNSLTDLLLETARLGERHVPAHFGELMKALLPRVSARVRADISRRLAACELVSADVARLFVIDEPDIAAPMLRQCPALTPQDLHEIAIGEDDEKARAVAGRTDLTRDVLSALIDRNDPVIGASLALSQAPSIDEATAERIARIYNLPRVAARRLIEIADLSDAALAGLFWLVEEDARRRILDRIAERQGEEEVTDGDNKILGEALFALAAVGDRAEITSRISAELSLPRSLGARIVNDYQGEPLAVATRAAGIPLDKATGIILLTVTEAGRSYDALRTLVTLNKALTISTASRIVGLWAGASAERAAPRHAPAVARPASRVQRGGSGQSRRIEDIVADINRKTGS
jgi:uncharacterized protein (DUF2336 family)